MPIESYQDSAFDSPEDEQRIRRGENDVLKCFGAPGAELDADDVMEMLPGISKRTAQKRLKALFEGERSPAVKRVALSCTSRSSFRPDAPFANRARPVRNSFASCSRFHRVQGWSSWIRLAGARARDDWGWQARDGRFSESYSMCGRP